MKRSKAGFTLLEIVVVIVIIGIVSSVVASRTGNFYYWQDESAIRKLSDLIVFLHNRAKIDGIFYRMDFDLDQNSYQIYQVANINQTNQDDLLSSAFSTGNVGYLNLELSEFLNPAVDNQASLIAPETIPSLAKPQKLPGDMKLIEIKNQRGEFTTTNSEQAFLLFSPRGFSEFGVIHLKTSSEQDITIVINPFTGNTKIYRSYRDFAWTFNRN